jgi:hypothetical protein
MVSTLADGGWITAKIRAVAVMRVAARAVRDECARVIVGFSFDVGTGWRTGCEGRDRMPRAVSLEVSPGGPGGVAAPFLVARVVEYPVNPGSGRGDDVGGLEWCSEVVVAGGECVVGGCCRW